MNHLNSSLKISLAQYCDKGIKPENQDTVGARIPEGNTLLIKGIAIAVADGVSSSSSAAEASQTAIKGFLTDYYATPDTWRTQQSATQVIKSLNQYLWGQSQNCVRQEGFLTTFSCIIFKGDKCFIFHIGDTRVYRVRDGHLEQLTRDHTQRIDRKTTYLSRALGADVSLEIDMHQEEIQANDLYLLTSDGIHDAISRKNIEAICNKHTNVDTISESLSKTALENKTDDNLSAQVIRIDSVGTPSKNDAVTVLSGLPFPPPMNIGNKIDGWEVQKIMHESERSQVYFVRNEFGATAVMKTPSQNYQDDSAYIERFVMESWIGARIQSAHVVRVIQASNERTFLYYLTEHIPGPTIAEIIAERAPLAIPDAIELIEQIVKGIRTFHRKDTLHQDIKPENIVVSSNGAVIIDFGSCWVAGIEEAGAPFTRDTILGTLRYSAPEYRYGGNIGHQSDQFSLAIIFYEMLTGKTPYGERYERAMNLKAFQKLKYNPARAHNPLVPFWLDQALEKALNVHPNSRYGALSEWLQDIKRPNPAWLSPREVPLLERDPLTTWKLFAAVGWLLAIAMILIKR